MKLEIPQAIHLVLALPAHRSSNEAHRELGKKALDELLEYKQLGSDDTEKAYNKAMIAGVLSTARAFSVERDRISGAWRSIDAIKKRRERLLDIFQNLSPLARGNYWSKAVAIIVSVGFAMKRDLVNELPSFAKGTAQYLLFTLVGLEVTAKLLEYLAAYVFENRLPIEKDKKWQEESMATYKRVIGMFVADAVQIHRQYFPDSKEIAGCDIETKENVESLARELTERCFYC